MIQSEVLSPCSKSVLFRCWKVPLFIILLIFLMLNPNKSYAQWSSGISGCYSIPIGGLENRVSQTFGFSLAQTVPLDESKNLMLYGMHSSFETSNQFRERMQPFFPDSLAHFYREANSEMRIQAIGFNILRSIETNWKIKPYWLYGTCVLNYKSKIFRNSAEGETGLRLITAEGNDSGLNLPVLEEERTTFGADLGVGVCYPFAKHIHIDLRCTYQVIIGELIAAESYGIEQIFPMQFLNLGMQLSYVF